MGSKLRIAAVSLAAAVTAFGMGVFATPAGAVTCTSPAGCDTTVTFTITSGALQITVPSAASLGTNVAAGTATVSGDLGSTSVSDQRGNLSAIWTDTVSSTNFTTGTAVTACAADPTSAECKDQTVSNGNVTFAVDPTAGTTSKTGTGALTGTVLAGVPLSSPAVGASWLGVGVNTATFHPTIAIVLLNQNNTKAVNGDYTGTITQSVA